MTGAHKKFPLSVEKLSSTILLPLEKTTPHIALDTIRISVRTKVEEGIKIGNHVKLLAKLFLPAKIAPLEYAHDFTRIAYYQKISLRGFGTSKIALHKKANKFQEHKVFPSIYL